MSCIKIVAFLALDACLLFHVVESKSNFQRKICFQYNYCGEKNIRNCTSGKNGTLNYLRAVGSDDALHYTWSTVEYPTVVISRSPLSAINISNCLSNFKVNNYQDFNVNQSTGSVGIDGVEDNFSFALIFKNLIEFSVNKKKLPALKAFNPEIARNCTMDSTKCPYHVYHLNNKSLIWSPYSSSDGGMLRAFDKNSSFFMNLKVNPRHDEDYERGYFPKPWYTANSTTFDLLIKNFVYQFHGKASRLALEVDLVQGRKVSNNGTLGQTYSKDDEYTPSIFYTRFFSFDGAQGHGHIRWKPITYITHHRRSSESQQANPVMGETVSHTALPRSLARAIFGTSYSHCTTMYLVFGTEKDDNALNSGMYTWTGSIGYGDQPDEPFSTLVILVLVIGLGIPAVLTVLAISFVFTLNIYKWHKGRRGYRRI